jgi:hypothetical protein
MAFLYMKKQFILTGITSLTAKTIYREDPTNAKTTPVKTFPNYPILLSKAADGQKF